MPQESRSRSGSRRSLGGYRAFISCEDPRGVAEDGTIKKPKIALTQKEGHGKRLESDKRRKHKNLAKGGVEEGKGPTSFHFLEVSRGAQTLNNVISSWSSGHSTDIAHDLLEGALDLRESLAILSRLHRQKLKVDKGWFDDDNDDDDDLKIEEKDFVEDMKKVMRYGVGRQNVVADEFSSEESCSNRRLDAFDAPSTSSSQFSIVKSSQMKKDRKTKRPNLIAKLMGLEEASLRSMPYRPSKHFSKDEKIMKQKKSTSDTQPFSLKKKWNDDIPPIVILRPLRFSCVDLERPVLPKSRGEVYDETCLGMRVRTNPLAQTDECEALNFKEAKARERTYLANSKSHKEEFAEKNAEAAQKMSESKREMKGWKESRSHLQSQDGRQGTKSKDILVDRTALASIGNQRYKAVMSDSSLNTEDASQIVITDYVGDEQSSPSEAPLLFGNQRNNENTLLVKKEYGKTDHTNLSHCSTTDTTIQTENTSPEEEELLYSVCDHLANGNQRQPLINRVEELFDDDINQGEISARELLDTANELISLHSSRCSRSAFLPLTRSCSSFERLLDEVCDEIKILRRYGTAEGDNHHSTGDSVLLLVKGDLRTRGMVGGMWDMGWMNAGSADEIQGITRVVQEMVLDGLIEEILL